MRAVIYLTVCMAIAGCAVAPEIDRAALDARYEQTALAEGVRSAVPTTYDRTGEPPVVVNWWYAGTRRGRHCLVFRSLTWDAAGRPVGTEQRYRVAEAQLKIKQPFEATRDDGRWVPLHEAADGIAKPPDAAAVRVEGGPVHTSPVESDLIEPNLIEPGSIDPDTTDPDAAE